MSAAASSSGPAVVLLSGGLDSAVTLAAARQEGFACHALTFRYGQRHALEVESARAVAAALKVQQHLVMDIDLRQWGGSAMVSGEPVPRDRDLDGTDIPPTYVPGRNIIFLSFALAWAEVLDARDIFLGVHAVDYSGYPDCRPEFLRAFEAMAAVGTKAGVLGRGPRIRAPLLNMNKADIIRMGQQLGVDFGLTRSCYDPGPDGKPCGHCDSCRIRAKGFAEAGLKDAAVT